MNNEFEEYELHLQMYNDALAESGEAHARYMYGDKPIKPEGYDEWKKQQPLTELEQRQKKYEQEEEELRQKRKQETKVISSYRHSPFLDFTADFDVKKPDKTLKWHYTRQELQALFPLYNLSRDSVFASFGEKIIFGDIALPINAYIQKDGDIFRVNHFYSELGTEDNMNPTPSDPPMFTTIKQWLKKTLPPTQIKEKRDDSSYTIECQCKGGKIILSFQDNGHAYLYKLLIQ